MLIFSYTYKCVCVFIILYAYFFERKYFIWINSYALVTDLKAMGCISSFFSELSQRILDKLASLMASTCAEKLIPKLQFPKTNLFQITTYIIMFWKVEFEMYIGIAIYCLRDMSQIKNPFFKKSNNACCVKRYVMSILLGILITIIVYTKKIILSISFFFLKKFFHYQKYL